MIEQLSRRQVRYWCFRWQNEATGGAGAQDAPAGLKAHFESQQFFQAIGGWAGFAAQWDVSRQPPWEIVPRDKSVAQEWLEVVTQNAKELPTKPKRKRKKAKLDPARNKRTEIDITLNSD